MLNLHVEYCSWIFVFLVCRHVAGALNEFKPDFVMYNAGTDILINDPLGRLVYNRTIVFLYLVTLFCQIFETIIFQLLTA